jgi:hypothetical protein
LSHGLGSGSNCCVEPGVDIRQAPLNVREGSILLQKAFEFAAEQ